MRKVSVLYLIGAGRSGTTLLSRLLDLQTGYRAVGEVRNLADDRRRTLPCGCGDTHESCVFWKPQLDRWADPGRAEAWNSAVLAGQLDQMNGLVFPHRPRAEVRRGLSEVRSVYTDLGADDQIVVDESKTPWLGYLLSQQPWAEVRFVELLRAPDQVMTSAQKQKDYVLPTSREVVAKHWLRTCGTASTMRKRTGSPWLRASYVQLANEPDELLKAILGHSPEGLHRNDAGTWSFESPAAHIFHSNPDKLRRGEEAVRPTSVKPSTPALGAGPWERLALRYWNRWLRDRVDLRQRW